MKHGWNRISASFTWRRVVLLIATAGVALALVERDRRLKSWHAEVAEISAALVRGEVPEQDVAVPGAEFLSQEAAQALSALGSPRRVMAVEPVEGAESSQCRVEVRGAGGGRVELTWAGRPPKIVTVRRREPSPIDRAIGAMSTAPEGASP